MTEPAKSSNEEVPILDVIGLGTRHDEFTRCPGCGHATVGLVKPWSINHAAGCEVAEFVHSTTDRGAVQALEKIAALADERGGIWTPVVNHMGSVARESLRRL